MTSAATPGPPEPGGVAIGVDVGGTKILTAVVTATGQVRDRESRATPGRDAAPETVEETIADAVRVLCRRHGPATVGLGAAGFVDHAARTVRFAPHLPWRDRPVAARLEALLGSDLIGSVVVDNDANTALWAEARFGAAQGRDDVVMVTLGTGLGGAVFSEGVLHRGDNGMAGEFGHLVVVRDGRSCPCGNRGCWEQYASGSALTRAATERGCDLAGAALTAAAEGGNENARDALAEVGTWLGVGVAALAAVLDPGTVIVGGGVAAAGELLLAPARTAFAEHVVGRGYRSEPEILVAALGPAAGAIGAADLARVGPGESRPGESRPGESHSQN